MATISDGKSRVESKLKSRDQYFLNITPKVKRVVVKNVSKSNLRMSKYLLES